VRPSILTPASRNRGGGAHRRRRVTRLLRRGSARAHTLGRVARVGKAPLLTAAGGTLLAVSLFLPWYGLFKGWTFYAPVDDAQVSRNLGPVDYLNAWQSFRVADVLMAVAAAVALAGTALADRVRGGWGWFALAVVGAGALAGVMYSVFNPATGGGAPYIGFFFALFGAALIAAGGLLGAARAERG
jgi:hypothetical protein